MALRHRLRKDPLESADPGRKIEETLRRELRIKNVE